MLTCVLCQVEVKRATPREQSPGGMRGGGMGGGGGGGGRGRGRGGGYGRGEYHKIGVLQLELCQLNC